MWVISNIRQYLENIRDQNLISERYCRLAAERKAQEEAEYALLHRNDPPNPPDWES